MSAPGLREIPKSKRQFGVRHIQASLTFLGLICAFALRTTLSVTIIAMVDKNNTNPNHPVYDWSSQTQSVVLSGFPWGYFILQIPGGILAEKYGPSSVIAVAQLVPSIVGIFTPLAASGGWILVFVFRFMQGIGQGMLVTAIQVHMARWAPVKERSVLVSLSYTASTLGTVLGLLVGGVLSTSAGGWPSVFYVFGGLGVASTVLWTLLGSNSPTDDRYISNEERAYIEYSLRTNEQGTKPSATPWRAILTSLPIWANVVASCGWSWGYWMLLTELPTYIKVLGFTLTANGFLSALPYLLTFILCVVFSAVSDYLEDRKIIPLTFSRKLFNSIGFFIPAVALIVLAYSQDLTLSVVLLVIAVCSNAAAVVGVIINNVDLAPNYAGTIFGFSNGLGSFVGCLAPLFVGAVVTQTGSVAQWQLVFLVASGVYISTGVFFMLFGQAEQQSWNDPLLSEQTGLLPKRDR